MKTKIITLLKLLPVFLMVMAFTSCEEVHLDVDLDEGLCERDYRTEYLCSRTWEDKWHDRDGVFYRQELRFYGDYMGRDYLYSEDCDGYCEETVYEFAWDWRNASCTRLQMKYGPGDYSYMEEISMGGNKLACRLDGESVCFVGR